MSKQIFERHVDERGNVSVRISDKFVVLTHDKAELIKAKFDQLEAENAKLRDERDRMYKANVEKNGEILRLLEENAKLRELCAALYEFAYDEYPDSAELNFASSMRELGVEVEG